MSEFLTEDQRTALGYLDLRDLLDLQKAPEHFKYNCPACGSSDGLHDYHGGGTGWHCFVCHKDALDILAAAWQGKPISRKEAKDKLIQAGLIPADETRTAAPLEATQKPQEAPKEGKHIQTLAEQEEARHTCGRAADRLARQADDLAKEAWRYLTEDRGLKPDTIKAFGLGCLVDTQHGGRKAICIPDNPERTRYELRYLDNHKPKTFSQAGLEKVLWAQAFLHNSEAPAVFVVEGAFDGMSILQEGKPACALNSTENKKIFISHLAQLKADGVELPKLVLALDSDKAGREALEYLAKELNQLGVAYSRATLPEGEDPNSLYTKDREGFKAWLEKSAAAPACDPYPTLADYVESGWEEDLKAYQASAIKTGWEALDNTTEGIGGLHAGLYVLGGRPGIGKTTFCWQLADKLASDYEGKGEKKEGKRPGKNVLYFALEQGAFDMTLKSIASQTGLRNWEIRAYEGLTEKAQGKVQGALAERKPIMEKQRVVENTQNFNTLLATIEDLHAQGKADCVFIDYLQIIPTPDGSPWKGDRIEALDTMMTKLRQTARRLMLPIVVVSANNRESYNKDTALESFKGSSGIEYSADVALLLLTNTDFSTSDKQAAAKNAKEINRAMQETARDLKLAIVKNRYGGQGIIELTHQADLDTFN